MTNLNTSQAAADMAAVQHDGMALKYVKAQTPALCLAAVRQDGLALRFVTEQTHALCMVAVQQDGSALMYVDAQTPELCMVAVQQNGLALEYVKEQTPELCMAAVQQDGRALERVTKQTPELCMAAVQGWGGALEYVRDDALRLSLETMLAQSPSQASTDGDEPMSERGPNTYKITVDIYVRGQTADKAKEHMIGEFEYQFGQDNDLVAFEYVGEPTMTEAGEPIEPEPDGMKP